MTLPLARVVMFGRLVQEVADRTKAEATAAAQLATEGHALSIWTVPVEPDETRVLGLHRADSRTVLDQLLAALPLYDWMQIAVTELVPHSTTIRSQHPVDLISARSRSSDVALSAIASVDARREDEGTGVGLARLGMRGKA